MKRKILTFVLLFALLFSFVLPAQAKLRNTTYDVKVGSTRTITYKNASKIKMIVNSNKKYFSVSLKKNGKYYNKLTITGKKATKKKYVGIGYEDKKGNDVGGGFFVKVVK